MNVFDIGLFVLDLLLGAHGVMMMGIYMHCNTIKGVMGAQGVNKKVDYA